MRMTGPGGYCLPHVEVAGTWLQRWRGLMGRSPRPVLLRTSMVHGFWLRQPVWLVGLDDHRLVTEVRLLPRRRLAWLRGSRWIMELPGDAPLPTVGDRLAFHPDDGEADLHGRTPLPVRDADRQPG